ncbi:hypothetical protein CCMA1212_003411 [Trichoderma ghanense]|uniref:Uncharacterized protein n=1 Tax=Trichoderma ghanense TaxID=65468 RepID=A0ABY2HAK2_9HYPO
MTAIRRRVLRASSLRQVANVASPRHSHLLSASHAAPSLWLPARQLRLRAAIGPSRSRRSRTLCRSLTATLMMP